MTELQTGVLRRNVIEAWIQYDARKKSRSIPNLQTWPWQRADDLDQELRQGGYKTGIIAGYLSWTLSAITIGDLYHCAVVSHGIPGAPRCLGQLESTSALRSWRPNCDPEWYERIAAGGRLKRDEPLLIRRSVPSEAPADWYLEDGSGRALALVQAARHSVESVVGYAYMGTVPDHASTFMKRCFPDLLT